METFTTVNQQVLEDEIISLLKELGVPPHLMGYPYIKRGIQMVYKNPKILRAMTAGFYPLIAQEFDTTPSRVERAIRHSIEVAYSRNSPSFLNEVLGIPDYNKGKLTNSEFFARVNENLKARMRLYMERKTTTDPNQERLEQLRADLITLGVIKE